MTKERFEELASMSKKEWKKYSQDRSNDKEYSEWHNEWRNREEQELHTVDLSKYMHMNSDEIQKALGDFFETDDWTLLPNGLVSPRGSAYHTALMGLRDENRTLEGVQYWIENLPPNQKYKYAHLKDKIADVHVTPYVMAECGCCTQSGGEHFVTFEDGSTIQFDSHGRLEPTTERGGFRWLRR